MWTEKKHLSSGITVACTMYKAYITLRHSQQSFVYRERCNTIPKYEWGLLIFLLLSAKPTTSTSRPRERTAEQRTITKRRQKAPPPRPDSILMIGLVLKKIYVIIGGDNM